MTSTDTAKDRGALRPPDGDDITGPRTYAPMWAAALLTPGEWAAYTALWSYADPAGRLDIPTHQELADRAWVERGTAANAVRRFAQLGLLTSGVCGGALLVDICPPALFAEIVERFAGRMAEQATKRRIRRRTNRAREARRRVATITARMAMWSGCWICGGPKEAVDHVKPRARGGPDLPANYRPICTRCNTAKSDRWHGPRWAHALTGSAAFGSAVTG